MYDLIIIGAGPGGVAAGVYAARKKMKSLLITDSFGGQSSVSGEIQNWVGTKTISGYDLAKSLEEHLRAQTGIEIVDDDLVAMIKKKEDGGFLIKTKNGKSYETMFVLLATGSNRKKLGIPGEKEHDGKGVVYCATCDAPLFGDKTVVVVGGGNSALESVIDLVPYASKIYLMVRSDVLKGDPVSQDKIRTNPKVEIIWNATAEEVKGEGFVNALQYKDLKTGESKDIAVEGVFVEIGLVPNSDFVKDLVVLNERGEVVADPKTQSTSMPGIWAVGDVTDAPYRQNNISAGDAVKAILNIYDHVKKM